MKTLKRIEIMRARVDQPLPSPVIPEPTEEVIEIKPARKTKKPRKETQA